MFSKKTISFQTAGSIPWFGCVFRMHHRVSHMFPARFDVNMLPMLKGKKVDTFVCFFLVCTSQSTVLRPKFCQHVCLQNLGAAYDAEQSLSLCFVFCFAFVRNTLCYSTFKTWRCQNGATNTWFFCKCVAMKMPICISSCCKPFRQCETRPPWLKFWIQSSHFLRGRCGLCPRHDGKFSSQCHNGSMQV